MNIDRDSWICGWLVAQDLDDSFPNREQAGLEFDRREAAEALKPEHNPHIQEPVDVVRTVKQ